MYFATISGIIGAVTEIQKSRVEINPGAENFQSVEGGLWSIRQGIEVWATQADSLGNASFLQQLGGNSPLHMFTEAVAEATGCHPSKGQRFPDHTPFLVVSSPDTADVVIYDAVGRASRPVIYDAVKTDNGFRVQKKTTFGRQHAIWIGQGDTVNLFWVRPPDSNIIRPDGGAYDAKRRLFDEARQAIDTFALDKNRRRLFRIIHPRRSV